MAMEENGHANLCRGTYNLKKVDDGVDNIKMDLREIGRDGIDWIDLVQDRDQWSALVKKLMNLRVP
jgi:hypothetical protein